MIKQLKICLLLTIVSTSLLLLTITLNSSSTEHKSITCNEPNAVPIGPYYVTRVNSTAQWQTAIYPDSQKIFFHETSGRQSLDLRQSCAVESTARHNPDRPIHLFMQTDRVNLSRPWLSGVLDKYDNIAVFLINAAEYFADSPLEKWYRTADWRNGPYRQEHFSDYIRMLSSLRFGGLYMDMDFVTLRKLDEKILWNFFPVENKELSSLNGGIFHLEHGHWMTQVAIRLLAAKYNPKLWGSYGPDLITDAMTKHCGFQKKKSKPPLNPPCNHCGKNVTILPYHFFYPIPWQNWRTYFEEPKCENITLYSTKMKNSFSVHVWNKLSHKIPMGLGSKQLYATLAAEHCPLTASRASEFWMPLNNSCLYIRLYSVRVTLRWMKLL